MSNKTKARKRKKGRIKDCALVFFVVAILAVALYVIGRPYEIEVPISPPRQFSEESDTLVTEKQPQEEIERKVLPENLQKLYTRNEDARDFVLNYFEDKDKDFEIDLSEYENCDSVPLLMQWDKRWGYKQYSGELFGLSGCGPTCLSMVAIYLTGDTSLSPEYMRQFAINNGYSVDGNGTAWTLFSEGAVTLGLDVTEIPLLEDRVMENLEVGNPIVCIMGPGDFTSSGHYIVLTGVEDGQITVNDPNSYKNSQRTWTYDEIEDQIKNLWVIRYI